MIVCVCVCVCVCACVRACVLLLYGSCMFLSCTCINVLRKLFEHGAATAMNIFYVSSQ